MVQRSRPTPTLRVRLSDPDNDQVQAVIEISDASGVVRTLETGFVASGSEASVSVDPPLAAGSYSWRARARDSAGNTSDWSNTRAFTVQTPPNNRPPAVPELVAPADGANGLARADFARAPCLTPTTTKCKQ
jgi:hypothetical protein